MLGEKKKEWTGNRYGMGVQNSGAGEEGSGPGAAAASSSQTLEVWVAEGQRDCWVAAYLPR